MASFEEKVLEKCRKIPKGNVTTYRELARALGTKAYRAVGTALKKNKNPIAIPCHRVVKSDGDAGNYSGIGGKRGKIYLLKKEGVEVEKGRVSLKKHLYKFC